MEARIPLALVVLMLSACGTDHAASPSSEQVSQEEPSDSSDWLLTDKKSAIDGKVIEAIKTFSFPDGASSTQVRLKCSGSKNLDLAFQSNLESGEASPLVAEQKLQVDSLIPTQYIAPSGRIKLGSGQTNNLADYFMVSKYNNEARLIVGNNAIALHKAARLNVDANAYAMRPAEKYWNDAAIIRKILPIAIEFSDSTGTHELLIENNAHVLAALGACGGEQPIFQQSKLNEDLVSLDNAATEHTGGPKDQTGAATTGTNDLEASIRSALERALSIGDPGDAKIVSISNIKEDNTDQLSVDFVWSFENQEHSCYATITKNSNSNELEADIPYICYRSVIEG